MAGSGWRLHVWQNLGWHYSVWRGALSVHVHSRTGLPSYSTLLAGAPPDGGQMPLGGSNVFYTRIPARFQRDPNKAVAWQLRFAQKALNELAAARQSAIDSAHGGRK